MLTTFSQVRDRVDHRRGLVWRLTCDRHVEAVLIALCMAKSVIPCDGCAQGFGPFEICDADPNVAEGACCNCHYYGSTCSLSRRSIRRNPNLDHACQEKDKSSKRPMHQRSKSSEIAQHSCWGDSEEDDEEYEGPPQKLRILDSASSQTQLEPVANHAREEVITINSSPIASNVSLPQQAHLASREKQRGEDQGGRRHPQGMSHQVAARELEDQRSGLQGLPASQNPGECSGSQASSTVGFGSGPANSYSQGRG
ncbi:uncharacterized protein E0L32_004445 [Thyridium curvatum]|uniref:Uncharacterized protein n=1 Tax=Thyridium curvatum TaxID=1093900 RepID=A0A507AXF1_9PEZI|nr:uncharacterized protein E0L32_004445 [Thyridium curvatum]TPX15465.1 hypothetical protein E0L32_004445 [Thyridium curvatum]